MGEKKKREREREREREGEREEGSESALPTIVFIGACCSSSTIKNQKNRINVSYYADSVQSTSLRRQHHFLLHATNRIVSIFEYPRLFSFFVLMSLVSLFALFCFFIESVVCSVLIEHGQRFESEVGCS